MNEYVIVTYDLTEAEKGDDDCVATGLLIPAYDAKEALQKFTDIYGDEWVAEIVICIESISEIIYIEGRPWCHPANRNPDDPTARVLEFTDYP
jgi:hypothetical protein